jgi:hypothetical protein
MFIIIHRSDVKKHPGKEGSMRTSLLTMLTLLVVALAATACSNQEAYRHMQQEQQAQRIGEESAVTLGRALMSRVQAAAQEGGPVHAMDFCSLRAQYLTDEVEDTLRPGMQVKRTSFRYRNPLNAPDPYEEVALRYFEQAMAEQGSLPENYVQFVHANEYRYYKPIVVQEFCLNCHGDPATFPAELRQVLNERYPEGNAVNYEEGDFRGVIRVSIPTRYLR